ncbi:hypothetical protein QR680_017206 [Steinernema hermaphroditum]|uniref:Chondroitin proteoglycan 4 domain-containing protein n=1 Tax=Steinernema hermaphroditum TaxID=289476 RepID=A0AA39LNQ6_9BILA|nr:hypothetical protein QR680_017206 [Steinernema hermaphroditum]
MPSMSVLWTVAFTATLYASTSSTSSLHCTRRCTVSFRNSLLSIMGVSQDVATLRMLAPFHEIVAKSGSSNHAIRKITWSCQKCFSVVHRFDDCLRRCPYSQTKSMKLASLHHWSVVCQALKKSNKEFVDFVECERAHLERVKTECLTLEIPPDISLKSFCRRILKYKNCYNKVPFHCTANAIQLWKQIDMAIADSFLHVSKLNSNRIRIPGHCDWAITGAPHSFQVAHTETIWSSTAPPVESASLEEFAELAAIQRNRTLRTEETMFRTTSAIEQRVEDEEAGGGGPDPQRPVANASTTRTIIRYFENFAQSSSGSPTRRWGTGTAFCVISFLWTLE